jgi:hypothetical protein
VRRGTAPVMTVCTHRGGAARLCTRCRCRASIAMLTTLFAGLAAGAAGADVRVQLSTTIPAALHPFASRTAGIVARQITSRCNATVVVSSSPSSSLPATVVIELRINASLGSEGYAVRSGATSMVARVEGGDARGLLFGAGRFLRTSQFNGPRAAPFAPGSWRGEGAPQLRDSFRAGYFAGKFP